MTQDDASKIITNKMKAGTVKECKMGTHKLENNEASKIRNGFVHIKIENAIQENIPDSILINKRRITILKPGQNLTRPCGFCQIRTHRQDECPYQTKYVQPKNALQENEFPPLPTNNNKSEGQQKLPLHQMANPKEHGPNSRMERPHASRQIEIQGNNDSDVFLIESTPESSGNLERLCQTVPTEVLMNDLFEQSTTDVATTLDLTPKKRQIQTQYESEEEESDEEEDKDKNMEQEEEETSEEEENVDNQKSEEEEKEEQLKGEEIKDKVVVETKDDSSAGKQKKPTITAVKVLHPNTVNATSTPIKPTENDENEVKYPPIHFYTESLKTVRSIKTTTDSYGSRKRNLTYDNYTCESPEAKRELQDNALTFLKLYLNDTDENQSAILNEVSNWSISSMSASWKKSPTMIKYLRDDTITLLSNRRHETRDYLERHARTCGLIRKKRQNWQN